MAHSSVREDLAPGDGSLRRRAVWALAHLPGWSAIYPVVFLSRWQPAIRALRRLNKVVRPEVLREADERVTLVHHAGCRSGKEYVTPVWAERVGQSFLIGLPYGTDVDWCRNVLAGGGCALVYRGERYDTTAPVILAAAEAEAQLPTGSRWMHRLTRAESYLRLSIGAAGAG